jgi:peptidoglycan/LPS O-acetylase OafA/YrhL
VINEAERTAPGAPAHRRRRPVSSRPVRRHPDRRHPDRRHPDRKDIDGLRAVAILAVVLYHAHVRLLGGGYVGVDVFFAISGYLITGLLWRELEEKGRVSFSGFYGRRMRRLLPASMLVLVVTMIASARWLPPLQTRSVWRDGLASALYVGNYRFALAQTNYLASTAPSPFQHYWSLGVEEQFYLLWPLLLVAASLVWRRRPPSRALAIAGLSIVAASSFLFSWWLTRADQPWAFFSLPARAWELAAGGVVALAGPELRRLPRGLAAALGWIGLASVVWSVVGFTASTAFPGMAALVPVGGATAVLAGGVAAPVSGPVLLLGRIGMRFLGKISYSWYLWHWPVLILAPYIVGHALAEWEYLALAAASAVLAAATFVLVEQPARNWRWVAARADRSLVLGGSLTACSVGACLVAAISLPSLTGHGLAPIASIRTGTSVAANQTRTLALPVTTSPTGPASSTSPLQPAVGATTASTASSTIGGSTTTTPAPSTTNPGIAQLDADSAQVVAAVAQSVAISEVPANLDPPLAYASASEADPFVDGCLLSYGYTSSPDCLFGDVAGTNSIVLFGDSHATMWFPAVDAFAENRDARLYVYTKATCPPVNIQIFSPVLGREFSECDEWRSDVLSRIEALKPSLVILGTAPNYDSAYQVTQDGPQWLSGLAGIIQQLGQSGARVVVLGPVPSPPDVEADCLSGHLGDVQACDVGAGETHVGIGLVGYDTSGLRAERRTVEHAGGYFVDVKPWFCTDTICPAIVDNLLVFRDNSHITVPYATYLAPLVADELTLASAPGL